ncbi:MAG: asparagine synthase (glutamine-hydrolyzing) [Bacteroidetes bacterium]|nr:asparagine synthase (glutamine-hydrolyzing) [Bacteroidota bacterium]
MCGITGIIRFRDKISPEVISRMNTAIRHRGLDDEGYISVADSKIFSYSGRDSVREARNEHSDIHTAADNNIFLGFRRLSIIDLSYNGHQPMLSPDKKLAITFNGEIYNYKELRQELQLSGYSFQTESDTEVILQGYRHWGKEVVHKLNGMFALAIYDVAANKTWIVRDRVGIKPLFYSLSNDGIVWSSEIKAIIKSRLVKPQINWQGLFANYQLQTTPSPYTCFENIFSLQPAHWLEIDINTAKITENRYWEIPVNQSPINITQEEATSFLDSKLQNIITKQLRSDVPVTSLMSGGIDSTTITAICAREHSGFNCYSLGFDGSGKGMDELPQAIAMAKMLGIKQHVHYIKAEDVVNALDNDLRHFEEPYVNLEPAIASSAYLHNEGYKVVMNGLGADEVFGGYSHYLDYIKWEQRRRLSFLKYFVPAINNYTQKVKNYLELDTSFKYFINCRMGLRPFEIRNITKKGFTPVADFLNEKTVSAFIPEELFYYDLKYYIGSHHVYRDDMSAMKYSLEVRYPYLDHELIEWVATLPMHIRYNASITKPLLRKVAERYITKENMTMPKKGFNLPLNTWMKESDAIQSYARQQLNNLKKRDIFNTAIIEKWWALRNEGVYFSKLWQLVTTEVWLSEYIDA